MKPSDYTFETFVATPSNRLAQLAAKKICETPDSFNPLYIYEAMQLYDDEVKCHGVIKTSQSGGMITPIVFDNDEYLSLILPVTVKNGIADRFVEYLKAA